MASEYMKALLVGDNPFHNISHLSQDRTRLRGDKQTNPEYAAGLIVTAVESGANGFLFSVSDTTLAILRALEDKEIIGRLDLYPIVPYAYEQVRLATQVGGIPRLARIFSRRLISSGSFGTIAGGLNGVLRAKPISLLKSYLTYEMNRVRAAAGEKANLRSILLHEIIVDMALSLELDWLFKEYSDFALRHNLFPGFNTCNFAYLVNKFNEWNINLGRAFIAAPFNKVGFQMNPSREDCEEVLARMDKPVTIAISVLAAGYLKLPEAVDYVAALPNIRGAAIGVSKEEHARQTFEFLKERLACC